MCNPSPLTPPIILDCLSYIKTCRGALGSFFNVELSGAFVLCHVNLTIVFMRWGICFGALLFGGSDCESEAHHNKGPIHVAKGSQRVASHHVTRLLLKSGRPTARRAHNRLLVFIRSSSSAAVPCSWGECAFFAPFGLFGFTVVRGGGPIPV